MAGVEIKSPKKVLLKDFQIPGTEIKLKAGTELNVFGKKKNEFQCLVSNHLFWVPKELTEIN